MTAEKTPGDNKEPLLLLCLIASMHGIAVDADSLAHQLALTGATPSDFDLLQLAASKLGLKASQESIALSRLHLTPLPALTRLHDGQWAIVAAANSSHVLLQYAQAASFSPDDTQDKTRQDKTRQDKKSTPSNSLWRSLPAHGWA